MTNAETWNLIASSFATILSAIAILLYIILWYKDKHANTYDTIDLTYLEILKIGIEHPSFRDRELTSDYCNRLTGLDRVRYETYAYIVWNFCETIIDKGDNQLLKTWSVVIETESCLHRYWFENPENFPKFKDSFRLHVAQNYLQNRH